MRLWVTRSQPGAERTAEALRRKGHEVVVQPVLEAQALKADLDLSRATALAFTSGHAVTAFAAISPRRDLPVYVTGQATAAQARAAGFGEVRSADGDAADLARLIVGDRLAGEVVWPCAQAPARDLAANLAAAGIACSRQAIYQTIQSATAAPSDLDGVLIHSARAASAVAKVLRPEQSSSLTLFALSEGAAEPLRTLPFASVAIALRPEESALLGLIPG
jgi:uroporphyrinogen-III synthase